jgi:hypothetical protein
MPLIQLTYASAATPAFESSDLNRIVSDSRQNNFAAQVTGILLYDSGSFLQVLEGEEARVWHLFGRIERDPRHERLIVLRRAQLAEREFGAWSMGFVDVGAIPDMPRLSHFVRGSTSGHAEPSEGFAAELLTQFRQGRWRQAVHP